MGNLKKLIFSLIFIISVNCFAQEYKFGKVSKEALLESSYPLDSTANAAVLYESRKIDYQYNKESGFNLVTEVVRRIKLYNKKGYDNAIEKIYLYKRGSDDEKVSGLKGVTYSLVNGTVVKTKLGKENIFKEELSEYRNQVKFTMPSLSEGSVIEYKYKIISPFVFNIDRIQLQYTIPIKKIEVKVTTPEYFSFKKRMVGYLPINLKETSGNGKVSFVSKSRSGGYNFSTGNSKTSYSNNTIDYTTAINIIKNSNTPAFKDEPYLGNRDNYMSSIIFELQYTKYPNSPQKNYATTWEDVTSKIYDHYKFGPELNKDGYFKEEIDQLISEINDAKKKTILIYEFVKNRMTWNKVRSVYARKGVRKAYKEKTGSAGDINLMLIAMLKYAKIDANPILVSTSDRIISLFPTLEGFNYVICRVKNADGSILYLDATDKYGKPNILPNRVIQGTARIIAENNTSQSLDLRPQKPSKNQYGLNYKISEDGTVDGIIKMRHNKYQAHTFRVRHGAKDEESQIKRLQKKYGIVELSEYKLEGVEKYGKGVNERFNFIIEDGVEIIEDELFLTPLVFLRDNENIFKSEERHYPIDFAYGYSNNYRVNIKIPKGYKVVELPKSEAFNLPEGIGSFSFRIKETNEMIQIVAKETINTPFLSAEYYPILKEFYSKLVEKENEQVILKKI
ncbi:DUF3857 domain-containing protein [Aquimarina longa]|uniref:DUF3857 domain-containing protein n=1 Tax=Aquimarina longa TaxID=1080221 RepID=UPI000786627A|nr:DUF3857 domain-containing protein [Aquimarina longa]